MVPFSVHENQFLHITFYIESLPFEFALPSHGAVQWRCLRWRRRGIATDRGHQAFPHPLRRARKHSMRMRMQHLLCVYIYIYQIFLHCRRNLSALHDVTDRSDTRLGQRIAHARGLATILTARRPPQRTRARCLCGMCVSAQRFACGREQLLPRACEPQAAQPALRPHAQCSAMSTRATSPRCDQPPSAASRQPPSHFM